jgi:hypothetical protein
METLNDRLVQQLLLVLTRPFGRVLRAWQRYSIAIGATIHLAPFPHLFFPTSSPLFFREQSSYDEKFVLTHTTVFARFTDEWMPHLKERSRVIPLHHPSPTFSG